MSDRKNGAPAETAPPLTKNATRIDTRANAGVDLLHEIVEVIRICGQCIQTIEQQRSERSRIDQRARVQIERIRSQREVMIRFLDHAFAERRHNFQEMFARIDVALAGDSAEGVSDILRAIVELARSSPFDALRDAASAHDALLNKDQTWEL